MVVDENERKIFFEIEFESVETPKREASIMDGSGRVYVMISATTVLPAWALPYCVYLRSPH